MKFFDKAPEIFDDNYIENKESQRELNVSLDLNQMSESLSQSQMP